MPAWLSMTMPSDPQAMPVVIGFNQFIFFFNRSSKWICLVIVLILVYGE
jgi:hypothetical protein